MANLSTGETEEVIQMINEARREKNKKKRLKLYINLNNYIVEHALFLPLFQSFNIVVYNNSIGKIKKNLLGKIDLFKLGKN